MIMFVTILRSTVEVEMYTRTQVTGTGIGSHTVNSGEEVTLSCQVSIIIISPEMRQDNIIISTNQTIDSVVSFQIKSVSMQWRDLHEVLCFRPQLTRGWRLA